MESNIKAEILYKPIMELKNFHNIDCQIINWKDSKIVINSKEKLCIQMNQLNYNNPISFISFLEFITENNLKIIEY